MRRSKTKRYENSIERTFEIKLEKPARGLRAVKIVIVLLLVAVIAGSVILVSRLYFSDDKKRSSAYASSSEESVSEELLRVVNKTNPLDKTYVPVLKKYDGYSVSVIADESLNDILNAAAEDKINLSVEGAYISYDEQAKLYKAAYKANLRGGGLTEVRAQAKTEASVPQAGNSEAQTGLLVTFKTKGKFRDSRADTWLRSNCIKFGFIERYPEDKTDETSMNANPKVYRYVGKDNAGMMRSLNKTLNEYVVYINSR